MITKCVKYICEECEREAVVQEHPVIFGVNPLYKWIEVRHLGSGVYESGLWDSNPKQFCSLECLSIFTERNK